MVIFRNLMFLLSGLIIFIILSITHATAEPFTGRGPGKGLIQNQSNAPSRNASIQFDTTLTNMFDNSADARIYDPQTIWVLQGLKEVAQPPWDPFDMDEIDTRRAVSKAFMIQGARHGSHLVNGSELKPLFREVKQTMREITNKFRYSLQADSDFLTISKEKEGSKILELNLEFNTSQGLDPQLRIFDSVRFRYDIIEKRHLFEYGLNF